LNVSAIFPATPVHSSGSRAEKSPRLNAANAASSCLASSSVLLRREPSPGRAMGIEVLFFIKD